MFPSIFKGLAVGIGLILVTVAIGFSIGLACSGGEYEVDTPEESDYAAEVVDELQPADEVCWAKMSVTERV